MTISISLDTVCLPSSNVVSREIEGQIIIVPLLSGIGDLEDELFTLNSTGKAIWLRLDGQRTLSDIIHELSNEYSAPESEVETDVMGLIQELVRRKMVDVAERA